MVLPAPTPWPFVFAVGAALIFSGLLTNVWVSLLGFVLWIFGAVGWFRQVLPHEHHEEVPVIPEEAALAVEPAPEVVHLEVAADVKRAWLPLKVYPVSAGVKGGLAGGVAMALLAMLYGVISHHSIWYPINLIAGSLYAAPAIPTMANRGSHAQGRHAGVTYVAGTWGPAEAARIAPPDGGGLRVHRSLSQSSTWLDVQIIPSARHLRNQRIACRCVGYCSPIAC